MALDLLQVLVQAEFMFLLQSCKMIALLLMSLENAAVSPLFQLGYVFWAHFRKLRIVHLCE